MIIKKRTIGFTVMLRVIPVACLVLIAIWLGVRYFALQSLRKEILDNFSARSHQTAEIVSQEFNELKEYTKILSLNDLVTNGLIDYTNRENYLVSFFQSLKIPRIKNARISLLDYKGRMITSNLLRKKGGLQPEIINTLMQGKSVFALDSILLTIAYPVYYNSLPEGIFLVQVPVKELQQIFKSRLQTMKIIVVGKNEKLIFTTDKDFFGSLTPADFSTQNRDDFQNKNSLWLKNTMRISGYKNFQIICGVDNQEILMSHLKLEIFLIAAMILDLLALILGIYLSTRLTAEPLRIFVRLFHDARKSRSFMAELPEEGAYEIKSLASAFNILSREREQAKAESLSQAFETGRAQLSAMVLHNIGNALTPLVVWTNQLDGKEINDLQQFFERCFADLEKNKSNLTEYVHEDQRGRQVFQYLGNLIDTLKDVSDRQKRKFEDINKSVSYISEILSLQQSYPTTARENKEKVDLNEIMDTAVRIQRPAIAKRDIIIEIISASSLKPVYIDKSRLLQVLANLLKNGYEAIDQSENTGLPKKITIATFITETEIGYTLTDTGIGIDLSKLNSLFEFGTSQKGSSGMGLYYCRMVIESNNGEISLTSEGIGKGAVVKIVFNLSVLKGISQ